MPPRPAARPPARPARGSAAPLVAGLLGIGAVSLALLTSRRASASSIPVPREDPPRSPPPPQPEKPAPSLFDFDADDIEAAARMIASENPTRSIELHAEQLMIQVRQAQRLKRSLYQVLTGGLGWGPQGGARPASTRLPATEKTREEAILILSGAVSAEYTAARSFFQPDAQDKLFAAGEAARAKQKRGEPLSDAERRALTYKTDAEGLRARWSREKKRYLGTVEGVEFWT